MLRQFAWQADIFYYDKEKCTPIKNGINKTTTKNNKKYFVSGAVLSEVKGWAKINWHSSLKILRYTRIFYIGEKHVARCLQSIFCHKRGWRFCTRYLSVGGCFFPREASADDLQVYEGNEHSLKILALGTVSSKREMMIFFFFSENKVRPVNKATIVISYAIKKANIKFFLTL